MLRRCQTISSLTLSSDFDGCNAAEAERIKHCTCCQSLAHQAQDSTSMNDGGWIYVGSDFQSWLSDWSKCPQEPPHQEDSMLWNSLGCFYFGVGPYRYLCIVLCPLSDKLETSQQEILWKWKSLCISQDGGGSGFFEAGTKNVYSFSFLCIAVTLHPQMAQLLLLPSASAASAQMECLIHSWDLSELPQWIIPVPGCLKCCLK